MGAAWAPPGIKMTILEGGNYRFKTWPVVLCSAIGEGAGGIGGGAGMVDITGGTWEEEEGVKKSKKKKGKIMNSYLRLFWN